MIIGFLLIAFAAGVFGFGWGPFALILFMMIFFAILILCIELLPLLLVLGFIIYWMMRRKKKAIKTVYVIHNHPN